MEKKLEPRYIVIKKKDLEGAFRAGLVSEIKIDVLCEIIEAVDNFRQEKSWKKPFECVVIESDWPMYKEVVEKLWQQIEGVEPKFTPEKNRSRAR